MAKTRSAAKTKSRTVGQRSLAVVESWLTKHDLPDRTPIVLCKTLATRAKVTVHEVQAAFKILRDSGCGGPRGETIRDWIEKVHAGQISATTVAYNYIPGMNSDKLAPPAPEPGLGKILLGRAQRACGGETGSASNINILRALLGGQASVLAELERQENGTWVGAVCGELAAILQDVTDGAAAHAAKGGE